MRGDDEKVKKIQELLQGQSKLLNNFIKEYPDADVTALRELQAETNVAAGVVLATLEASDEVPLSSTRP